MHEMWLALPTGILISTVVSSIGIGGGILWMPFLLVVLKMNPETAVSTSLLIQTFGKGSGSIAYIRQRTVDHKLALLLILIAVPGVMIGGQIGPRITKKINERLLKEVFIFLLTLVGIHLIYNSY